MVGYANELGKRVELTVLFEKKKDTTRPDSWNNLLNNSSFEYFFLNGINCSKIYWDTVGAAPDDKALAFDVLKYLSIKYDIIIVGNPCTPTGIIAIMYMKFKGISYSIQSEGGFSGTGRGFKEKLKKWLMKDADYYFSTCELDDEYFYLYGATKERIKRYIFASFSKSQLPKEQISIKEKQEYKEKLGIPYSKMILSVGRSVYVKGFDILIRASKNLSINTCVYIVGGTCTEEYKKIIFSENIKNIFFVDNIEQNQLLDYYRAADIFVLPTRGDTWGLVINEAMSYGLPVITTDRCVAGDALIRNGYNGFIVETENVYALEEKIKWLLEHPTEASRFGEINYNKMRAWTYEDMAEVMFGHISSICYKTTY